jgi:predicted sugar kinase
MTELFSKISVGSIANPLKKRNNESKVVNQLVRLKYPARLNAMAIDPGKITTNENMVFTPGEVVFSIGLFKELTTELTDGSEIEISSRTKRKSLVNHAALLMKAVLGFEHGLYIDVQNQDELKHCGLGSSSGLIAGVAASINEIYGNPISNTDLIRYIAQNHGEEIDGDEEHIKQVQCIGGSAASCLTNAGALIIAGESTVIQSMKVPDSVKVAIGIPKDFVSLDAETLMSLEEANLHKFLATGQKYGPTIAYRMLHQALPALVNEDLTPLGSLIYDYRFEMGSIENCSFVYPQMVDIANDLRWLWEEGLCQVLSLSSVGPAFFALTEHFDAVAQRFEALNMNVIETEISNDRYQVLETAPLSSK